MRRTPARGRATYRHPQRQATFGDAVRYDTDADARAGARDGSEGYRYLAEEGLVVRAQGAAPPWS